MFCISIYFSYPQYLDATDAENGQYEKKIIEIQSIVISGKGSDGVYTSNNEEFLDKCKCDLQEGKSYEIEYLPRTRAIITALEIVK